MSKYYATFSYACEDGSDDELHIAPVSADDIFDAVAEVSRIAHAYNPEREPDKIDVKNMC